MRVAELRRELDSKGLDVDGSKEMISLRLKDADEEERKKNSIIVSGAGLDDANGVYDQTSELSDGHPVYQKIGTWRGRTGRFCVFRGRMSTNVRRNSSAPSMWFISFVLDGHRPGTTEDVDFYSADHDDDDDDDDDDANLPPKTGWIVDPDEFEPPPTVKRSEEK